MPRASARSPRRWTTSPAWKPRWAARAAADRTYVIVIDTDPAASTEAGGAWWDVAVPEVSERGEVGGGAGGLRREARRAAARLMTVRFGVSPIAWTNDDMPELGGDTSVETILADAAEIGFAGVELGGKFPARSGRARAAAGAPSAWRWSAAGIR